MEYAIMQTGYGFAMACFCIEGRKSWHGRAESIKLSRCNNHIVRLQDISDCRSQERMGMIP